MLETMIYGFLLRHFVNVDQNKATADQDVSGIYSYII